MTRERTSSFADMPESLFPEFPPPAIDEWRAQAASELPDGSDPEALAWTAMEGVVLQPLYTRADLPPLPGISPESALDHGQGSLPGSEQPPWLILQHRDLADPERARDETARAIAGGQNAIGFSANRPEFEYAITRDSFARLLDGLPLERLPLDIDAGLRTPALLALLAQFCRSKNIPLTAISGSVAFDPLREAEESGHFGIPWADSIRILSESVAFARASCPAIRTVAVDARLFHGAGATAVQELGFSLAKGVEYLRALTAAGQGASGHSAADAAHAVRFVFRVGRSFLPEIAKLRAARLLWAKAAHHFGVEDTRMRIHAETSRWDLSLCDPHVNILRGTLGTMAAVLGGADSVGTAPFDELTGSGESGERLARNTQLLLHHETRLARVVDAPAGSYYIEVCTEEIARAAWALFQETERRGGYRSALETGYVGQCVAQEAERKRHLVSRRAITILGANRHPIAGEKIRPAEASSFARTPSDAIRTDGALPDVAHSLRGPESTLFRALDRALLTGATIEDTARALRAGETRERAAFPALPSFRAAEPFERLRIRAGSLRDTPTVLLLAFGPLHARRARASFAREFFQIAGCETRTCESDDAVELLAAVRRDRPPMVVACSSDDTYPAVVPALVADVKAGRPDTAFLVAGYPRESIDALREAGVDDFIHVHSDAVAVLGRLLDGFGAPASERSEATR